MGRKDREIYSLDREIKKVQLDKNNEVRQRNEAITSKKTYFFKYAKVISILIIVIFGLHFLPIIICIDLMMFADAIDDVFAKKNDLAKEPLPYETLKDAEEYYTEEYHYAVALAKTKGEETRKYEEAVKRQNKNRDKIEVHYTKEDEIDFLVEGIETYFYFYELPPLRIKSYEWDAFFDTLYDEFSDKEIKGGYYHAVSEVIRYTLANALVNESDKINISDFINNLQYLCKTIDSVGIWHNFLSQYDVALIQSRIKSKIRKKEKEIKKYKRV